MIISFLILWSHYTQVYRNISYKLSGLKIELLRYLFKRKDSSKNHLFIHLFKIWQLRNLCIIVVAKYVNIFIFDTHITQKVKKKQTHSLYKNKTLKVVQKKCSKYYIMGQTSIFWTKFQPKQLVTCMKNAVFNEHTKPIRFPQDT